MEDLIDKQAALDAIDSWRREYPIDLQEPIDDCWNAVRELPAAQPDHVAGIGKKVDVDDCISRQAAIDALKRISFSHWFECGEYLSEDTREIEIINSKKALEVIEALPSVHPEKEIAKRVLWTGWKGCRNTRYKCPNCKKPVKNDDIYCHRCGQKLMFPHISFTDYVPGEKQETIVRWDDE